MSPFDARILQYALEAFAIAWAAGIFFAFREVNRRIARYETERGPDRVGMFGDVVPLGYAVALTVWPLAFATGFFLLRRPELARQARISFIWGFFSLSMVVLPVALQLWLWARSVGES